MRGSSCGRTLGILVIASCVPVMAGAQAPASPEEFARRQYESGLEFLHAGKYTEALKDFEAVVDIYPASSVADEALLAIARYQLDVQRNPMAAQTTAESLLKKFPASDSVAMSYVVAGQATVAKGADARQRRCGARQLRPGAAAVRRHRGRRAGARGRGRYAQTPWALPGGAR